REDDDVTWHTALRFDAVETEVSVDLGDARPFRRLARRYPHDRVAWLDGAVEHAPEREPAEVIGVVEVSDLEAERRFLVSLGGRNVVVDYLEEGSEIVARFAALQPRAAFS